MDHRGHIKKPQKRSNLPVDSLVESFLAETREEDSALFKQLESLDGHGQTELAGILGRFDLRKKGELDAGQRLLARRVLVRLRRHSDECLILTNKILDYLDLNNNAIIEEGELDLGVDLIELFAHADSDNDTLSHIELKMLYAVLRHIDRNDNGKLDPHEKEQLQKALKEPKNFLADQKVNNPLLKELLANRP
ncbi:MAG: hypothetical protein GY847_36755 [Proteobacteria bacterium]|nr:hypothetical protein [Pseudomonadota bacterium]